VIFSSYTGIQNLLRWSPIGVLTQSAYVPGGIIKLAGIKDSVFETVIVLNHYNPCSFLSFFILNLLSLFFPFGISSISLVPLSSCSFGYLIDHILLFQNYVIHLVARYDYVVYSALDNSSLRYTYLRELRR
jgi:hypothetical protein